MNKKKITGFVFIVLAIGIIISNVSVTGAVIGTSTSNSLSLVATVFLLIGAMLLISERRKIESRIEQLVASGVPQSKIGEIQEGIKDEYKTLPKDKRKAIYEEVANVVDEVQDGKRVGGIYNLHILSSIPPGLRGTVSAKKILEADAKVLNKYAHQGGRGTERYVFDNDTGELLGIAYHPRGNPRDLSWRKRF